MVTYKRHANIRINYAEGSRLECAPVKGERKFLSLLNSILDGGER